MVDIIRKEWTVQRIKKLFPDLDVDDVLNIFKKAQKVEVYHSIPPKGNYDFVQGDSGFLVHYTIPDNYINASIKTYASLKHLLLLSQYDFKVRADCHEVAIANLVQLKGIDCSEYDILYQIAHYKNPFSPFGEMPLTQYLHVDTTNLPQILEIYFAIDNKVHPTFINAKYTWDYLAKAYTNNLILDQLMIQNNINPYPEFLPFYEKEYFNFNNVLKYSLKYNTESLKYSLKYKTELINKSEMAFGTNEITFYIENSYLGGVDRNDRQEILLKCFNTKSKEGVSFSPIDFATDIISGKGVIYTGEHNNFDGNSKSIHNILLTGVIKVNGIVQDFYAANSRVDGFRKLVYKEDLYSTRLLNEASGFFKSNNIVTEQIQNPLKPKTYLIIDNESGGGGGGGGGWAGESSPASPAFDSDSGSITKSDKPEDPGGLSGGSFISPGGTPSDIPPGGDGDGPDGDGNGMIPDNPSTPAAKPPATITIPAGQVPGKSDIITKILQFFGLAGITHDPLTFDLDGDGIETISLNDSSTYFDLDNDNFKERTGWISKDDGLLVFDLNNNGTVDDINELFGNTTINGMEELKTYDSNLDGKIDSGDAEFSKMKIWQDLNEDGMSQQGEMKTLSELNIRSIDLNYDDVYQINNGNIIYFFNNQRLAA